MVAASFRFSPVRREKKAGSSCVLDNHETADVQGEKKKIKNMNHIGPLQANELVRLMLDRQVQTGKSGSRWFLADEQISGVRCSTVNANSLGV